MCEQAKLPKIVFLFHLLLLILCRSAQKAFLVEDIILKLVFDLQNINQDSNSQLACLLLQILLMVLVLRFNQRAL